MRILSGSLWLMATLASAAGTAGALAAKTPRVAIVLGSDAPELERYAAELLSDYLAKLFGVETRPISSIPPCSQALFLIGSPATNRAVKRATQRAPFPEVTDQGIVLRRSQLQERPALIVGGGSPQATLWAVAAAGERLLHSIMAYAHQQRKNYPGGAERAVREVKGDLTALYFYDRLLNDLHALKDRRRPDMQFVYATGAEELYPLLERILPRGSETLSFVDYTPARVVRRREALKSIPSREIPASLVYTLEDDNVGLLPQLTTGSLYELTQDLLRYRWAGFLTRYWIIGGQDPCVAYLARASWDQSATPDAVYRDQLRAVCGPACIEDMLTVFREVEAVTVDMEWHQLGFAFAVPGMMMKHWKPERIPADLLEDRRGYQRALNATRRALHSATPTGKRYVDYWVGRLEFAVEYLNAVEALRRAATAEAAKNWAEARTQAEAALAAAGRAIAAYARVARDQSDRGAIAQLNEFAYRPLRAKVAGLGENQGVR